MYKELGENEDNDFLFSTKHISVTIFCESIELVYIWLRLGFSRLKEDTYVS